jgi:hypothetical protein
MHSDLEAIIGKLDLKENSMMFWKKMREVLFLFKGCQCRKTQTLTIVRHDLLVELCRKLQPLVLCRKFQLFLKIDCTYHFKQIFSFPYAIIMITQTVCWEQRVAPNVQFPFLGFAFLALVFFLDFLNRDPLSCKHKRKSLSYPI